MFQVKVLDPRASLPQRATDMSAGYDLIACIDKTIAIRNGEKATLIPTGLALYIGTPNIAGILLPRSGLGHKQGLVLGNTLGLIDGDYQNQWFVSAWNRGQQDEIIINPGDRIAQVIFVPVIHPHFNVVFEFSEPTIRGFGGFGSTGLASGGPVGTHPQGKLHPKVVGENAAETGCIPETLRAVINGSTEPGVITGGRPGEVLLYAFGKSGAQRIDAVPRGSLGEEVES